MTPRQKVFAIMVCVGLFAIVINLVHKRKLKEEYAWVWLLTSASIFMLVIWYDLLLWLSALIGAVLPTTTLFLFGLLFFVFITLHFSIKISLLSTQVKNLAQQVAILDSENQELKTSQSADSPENGK